MTNDSHVQRSYANVVKPVLNSVATQTMFTWIENTDKPTRPTVQSTSNKTTTPSKKHQVHRKQLALQRKLKLQFHLEIKTSQKNKQKIQFSSGPTQGHGKMMNDPVQVHNELGHFDETVCRWTSRTPLLGDHQVDLPKEIGGIDLVGNLQTIPPFSPQNEQHYSMELSRP